VRDRPGGAAEDAVIAVVAPEPAPWLAALLRAPEAWLGDCGRDRLVLFAPWRAPGWRAAGRVLGRALRDRTRLEMAGRLLVRAAVDRAVARLLPGDLRAVVAPSGGALACFAVAARRGAATVLVQDLPLLRQLHADLDEAARRHPTCALLRRYRAPADHVVRQEREQVLAGRILARGLFAAEQLLAAGRRVRPLAGGAWPEPPPAAGPGAAGRRAPAGRAGAAGPRVLLAGPPCGRSGVMEALAAVAALPGAELLVRASDAVEPAGLLGWPMVRLARASELRDLAGVDAVIAPALCESHPPEVPRAVALGVPVVATRRAAGAVDLAGLAAAGAEVAPHDAAGLRAALERLTRQ
jgi:hypothetical protein